MSDRIDDLSERRRLINSRPWHLWQPDQGARVKRLNKLLEEAYEQKRKETAQSKAISRHKGAKRRPDAGGT